MDMSNAETARAQPNNIIFFILALVFECYRAKIGVKGGISAPLFHENEYRMFYFVIFALRIQAAVRQSPARKLVFRLPLRSPFANLLREYRLRFGKVQPENFVFLLPLRSPFTIFAPITKKVHEMKRTLLLLMGWAMVAAGAFAERIDVAEAQAIAERFSQEAVASNRMKAPRERASMQLVYVAQTDLQENCYYVFSRGAGDGFVMVAADDRAGEVLGYADNGTFDYGHLPENMKGWLEKYRREMEQLLEMPEGKPVKRVEAALETEVRPLLGDIAWNQDAPYNNMCPMYDGTQRCVTGCAATAMAQIMYYHRWPERGTGEHTYGCDINGRGQTLSANFGETEYAWDLMQPAYDASSSQESQDAVAELMYHCGVAMDMQYGLASGAYAEAIPQALYEYFGYDAGMEHKSRDFYTSSEWEAIIRNELDNGRPIEYSGQTANDGGHSFVCDGYDRNGYFHFNWGWGGMSNGYFRLSALEPSNQGIGGTAGGYNYGEGINIGIRPDTGEAASHAELCATEALTFSETTVSRDEPVGVTTLEIYNYGWQTAYVKLGYVLYDEAGEEVHAQDLSQVYEVEPYMGWKEYPGNFGVPNSLEEGTYTMRLCYQLEGSTEWQPVHVSRNNPPYAIVTVTQQAVNFALPDTAPDLDVSSIQTGHDFYQNRIMEVEVAFTNAGGAYYDDVYFALCDAEGTVYYISPAYRLDIAAGGEETMVMQGTPDCASGSYYLAVIDKDYAVVGLAEMELLPEPAAPNLALTAAMTFGDNQDVPLNDMRLTAVIRNNGGLYSGTLLPYIYTYPGNEWAGNLDSEFVILDEGETATVEFAGSMPDGTVGSTYYVAIYDTQNEQWVGPNLYQTLVFTLGEAVEEEDPTSINGGADAGLRVYPAPASTEVFVESGRAIETLELYSLGGVLLQRLDVGGANKARMAVGTLPSGTYLLEIATEEGRTVRKVLKQ